MTSDISTRVRADKGWRAVSEVDGVQPNSVPKSERGPTSQAPFRSAPAHRRTSNSRIDHLGTSEFILGFILIGAVSRLHHASLADRTYSGDTVAISLLETPLTLKLKVAYSSVLTDGYAANK